MEANVEGIHESIRSISFNSNGAISYHDGFMLSPDDRNEWIKFINKTRETDDKMRQELI